MMRSADDDLIRPLRVLWTRGKGCSELAEALAGGDSIRATGDVEGACLDNRAGMLVARRIPNAPLVSVASPLEFEPQSIGSVVALVSGGPHSALATEVAARLGMALDVSAELVSGYRAPPEREQAGQVLESLQATVAEMHGRVVEARTAKDLIESLASDSLLVLGAPGGSWIQRMFFGPGARMTSVAKAGAVVVKAVPTKVFQVMESPEYVSPMLGAGDALGVGDDPVLPVVEDRRLIGLVNRSDLSMAGSGVSVGAVMNEIVAVGATAGLHEVGDAAAKLGTDVVPVINDSGELIGKVSPAALR